MPSVIISFNIPTILFLFIVISAFLCGKFCEREIYAHSAKDLAKHSIMCLATAEAFQKVVFDHKIVDIAYLETFEEAVSKNVEINILDEKSIKLTRIE